MITNVFISLGYSIVSFFISLFPAGTGFPSSIHSAFSSLGGYLHILDPIFPISVLLTCVTMIFVVEIALFGFKTFKWIVSFIPFVGGSGK